MRQLPLVLVSLALILATAQAYLSFGARDDLLEATVAGRFLDTCAEVGGVTADFLAKAEIGAAEARGGAISERTFQLVTQAPRDVIRASYRALYMLPESAHADLEEMRGSAQKIVGAALSRDAAAMERQIADLDAANKRIQDLCRAEIADSPMAPGR